jgi:hypothetical protein
MRELLLTLGLAISLGPTVARAARGLARAPAREPLTIRGRLAPDLYRRRPSSRSRKRNRLMKSR